MRMATRAQAQAIQVPLSAPPLQAFVRSKSPVADQDQRLQVPGFEDLASPFLSTPVTTPPEEHASTTGIPTNVAIQRKTDASTAAPPGKSPLAQRTGTATSINDPSPVLAQPHNSISHAALPVTEMTGIDPVSQVERPEIEPQIRSEAPDPRMPPRPEPTRPRPPADRGRPRG